MDRKRLVVWLALAGVLALVLIALLVLGGLPGAVSPLVDGPSAGAPLPAGGAVADRPAIPLEGEEPVSAEAPAPAGVPEDRQAELAAAAAALAADPNTHVVCDLDLPVEEAMAYLAIGGHSDFNGRLVRVVDGKAYLPLVYDMGEQGSAEIDIREGVFSLDGYGPVAISWSDPPEDGGLGRCDRAILPESGQASLTGTLTLEGTGAPADGAWIEGCGNMAFVEAGGIVHMDIVSEPCSVIAMRQDGLLRTRSEVIPVLPKPGEDVVLDIVLPVAKRGGLGVQIVQTDEGISIEGLVDGGPAGDAGLQAGDLVVEVDGEPVGDMELGDFVQKVGGRAGTDVDLVVDRDGQRVPFTITRQALEQPG